MDKQSELLSYLNTHAEEVGKVVDYNPQTDRLFKFDFTADNRCLDPEIIADTEHFSFWVLKQLQQSGCRYGVGGYLEHRTLYSRSELFNAADEPRRLHLGMDIWAAEGTRVYSPLNGKVHSFQDNAHFGDYGPTIILEHNLGGLTLYSLYGHLSRQDLDNLATGAPVAKNQMIGHFGNMYENGHWPPHLHFQLMFSLEGKTGDYPGVCKYSEKAKYQQNVPDPNLILKFPI